MYNWFKADLFLSRSNAPRSSSEHPPSHYFGPIPLVLLCEQSYRVAAAVTMNLPDEVQSLSELIKIEGTTQVTLYVSLRDIVDYFR